MKVYEYDNGKGSSVINVTKLSCVYADNEVCGKFLIKYSFDGSGMHQLVFVDKKLRDDVLAKITELMKEA